MRFVRYQILLLFVVLLAAANTCYAGSRKADSLRRLLAKNPPDSIRMFNLENLAYFLDDSDPDTCILLSTQADSIADNLLKRAKGQWLKKVKETKAEITGLFGSAYFLKSDYPRAIKYDIEAIKIYEDISDSVGVGMAENNLANIYNRQNNFKAAADYFYKIMVIQHSMKNKLQEEIATGNLGLTYVSLGQYDSAKHYLLKSKELSKLLGDVDGEGTDLLNIGDMYNTDTLRDRDRHLDSALSYYRQALVIKIKTNEKEGLAICYDDIAGVYFDKHRFDTAISYAQRAEVLAKVVGEKAILQDLYGKEAHGYFTMKDYKKAYEYLSKYSSVTDSIFNENSTKQIAQIQAQYQTEKKQKQIELLKKDQEKQMAVAAAELKKKKTILFSSIAIILLLIGFAFFMYNRFVVIRSQKVVIEEQKALVDEKNKNLEEAKDIIEEKNKDITASIRYAQRIQAAILPPVAEIEKHLPQSFVLYKPKDIVAGDFYFFEKIDANVIARNEAISSNKERLPRSDDGARSDDNQSCLIISAADCTGHGVPGAMVSVVCSNALNRTVNEFGITEPGKILDKARELVLQTFEKSESNIQDGMDISLASFIHAEGGMTLSWAGAHNPLWYITNGEIKEVTADKQPIGYFEGQKNFTTHSISLSKGDTVYLMTDGYADQFGGERGKKFKYKQLQELLIANYQLPMQEQKQKLEQVFEKWKGTLEQTDDVCLIGIRV